MSHKKKKKKDGSNRKSVSQHLSDKSQKKEVHQPFVEKKKEAGKVERKPVPQISGGEGEKEEWMKSVTVSKSRTPNVPTPTTGDDGNGD